MAKKQTFGDKANSKKNAKDMIKVIKSSKSSDSGTLRFSAEMVRVPDGKTAVNVVKEMLSK